jgi:two-component system cell cycle sensor histidine kinase/response regulator CckA
MGILSAALTLFGRKEGVKSGRNGRTAHAATPGLESTILVIDDDTNFLETMRILLRDAGYNVLTSNNGPKGLDMLRYAPGGVRTVLLDFNMPGFNGAETLEHLRKLNPNAKVIAISGLKVSELPKSFQENVQRFIAKPFANGQLLETIEEVLAEEPDAEIPASASV